MDAIVVDTEKTGKDCIQYLREQVCKQLQLVLYFSILLKNIYTIPFVGTLLNVGMNSNIKLDIICAYCSISRRKQQNVFQTTKMATFLLHMVPVM